MGLFDSAIHDAKLMGWALVFSAVNGGIVGGVLGATSHDPGFHWWEAVLGGAIIGPALTLVFETPLRSIVQVINRMPIGWAIVFPFAILRFLMSWPGVMAANAMMSSRVKLVASSLCHHCDALGNGVCAKCHGNGDGCDRCRGNGKCPACAGTGRLD